MISVLLAALFTIVAVRFVWGLVEQYEVNQYFKKVSPNLPVVESPSLISGHSWFIFQPRNIKIMHETHGKFGKSYGFYYGKQPVVSTCDLDLVERVIVEDGELHTNRIQTKLPISEIEVDSLATAGDDQWRRIRRAFVPGLSSHKINSSQHLLTDINDTMRELFDGIDSKLEQFGAGKSAEVNITDQIVRSRVQLVFRSYFKQDSVVDFKSEKDYYSGMLEKFLESMSHPILAWGVMYASARFTIQWFCRTFLNYGIFSEKYLRRFLTRQIELNTKASYEIDLARKKTEQEGRFFDEENFILKDGTKFKRKLLDPIIDNFRAKQITHTEFMNSMAFLFFAAYKTSSDTESYLLYQLALNPKIQDKLRESLLKDGEDSQYLDWCMKESLRIRPPAPMGPSRCTAQDYTTQDGILIPKGTYLVVNIFTIHRMKELWGENSEEFEPERWANSKGFHPLQYLPFGYGKRICPGRFFADFTTKRMLAALLTRYKFSVSEKTPDNAEFVSPILVLIVFEKPFYLRVTKL